MAGFEKGPVSSGEKGAPIKQLRAAVKEEREEEDFRASKLFSLVETLGGKGRGKVYRITGERGGEVYLDSIAITDDLVDDFDNNIAKLYGGGEFVIKFYFGRECKGSHTVKIDEETWPRKKSRAEVNREGGALPQTVAELMQVIQAAAPKRDDGQLHREMIAQQEKQQNAMVAMMQLMLQSSQQQQQSMIALMLSGQQRAAAAAGGAAGELDPFESFQRTIKTLEGLGVQIGAGGKDKGSLLEQFMTGPLAALLGGLGASAGPAIAGAIARAGQPAPQQPLQLAAPQPVAQPPAGSTPVAAAAPAAAATPPASLVEKPETLPKGPPAMPKRARGMSQEALKVYLEKRAAGAPIAEPPAPPAKGQQSMIAPARRTPPAKPSAGG